MFSQCSQPSKLAEQPLPYYVTKKMTKPRRSSRNPAAQIFNKIVKSLEDKITSNLQQKIQNLVEDSINFLWKDKVLDKCRSIIKQQVSAAKNDLVQLKENVNGLILKTDRIFGSIAYVADEYDDLNKKIYAASVQVQTNLQEFKKLKHELQEIKTRQNETTFQLDELEQYRRRLLNFMEFPLNRTKVQTK